MRLRQVVRRRRTILGVLLREVQRKMWAAMVSELDIAMIVPQQGSPMAAAAMRARIACAESWPAVSI